MPENLTISLSPISGKPLLCAFENCRDVAYKEFSLPIYNEETKTLEMHMCCSWQHQAALQSKYDISYERSH